MVGAVAFGDGGFAVIDVKLYPDIERDGFLLVQRVGGGKFTFYVNLGDVATGLCPEGENHGNNGGGKQNGGKDYVGFAEHF